MIMSMSCDSHNILSSSSASSSLLVSFATIGQVGLVKENRKSIKQHRATNYVNFFYYYENVEEDMRMCAQHVDTR